MAMSSNKIYMQSKFNSWQLMCLILLRGVTKMEIIKHFNHVNLIKFDSDCFGARPLSKSKWD